MAALTVTRANGKQNSSERVTSRAHHDLAQSYCRLGEYTDDFAAGFAVCLSKPPTWRFADQPDYFFPRGRRPSRRVQAAAHRCNDSGWSPKREEDSIQTR